MKIYLVGGAVRDELLGCEVKEKDYVVVGATVEDMLKKGFKQVGKDFPVFLHPKTGEEYALARKERKIKQGYTGFEFDASSDVTLEDDLKRRDLTINAMAKDLESQKLIDHWGGKKDIENKILRHVSDAFIEDPVRILRVARFYARFAYLGFKIADETMQLMQQMVKSGEVNALVPDRVWKELQRALTEKNPEKFFEVLHDCNALPILFPGLEGSQRSSLRGALAQKQSIDTLCAFVAIPARNDNNEQAKRLPEIDSLSALISATKLSKDPEIRFAALFFDRSEKELDSFLKLYPIPTHYKELTLLVIKFLPQYQSISTLSANELLELLQKTDAFRREERFFKWFVTCYSLTHNKESKETINDAIGTSRLMKAYQAVKKIDMRELANLNLSGSQIAEWLYQKRLEIIKLHC